MRFAPGVSHTLGALPLWLTMIFAACTAQPDDVADPRMGPTTQAVDTPQAPNSEPTPNAEPRAVADLATDPVDQPVAEPEPETTASATLTFPYVVEESCPGEFCNYSDDRACTTIPVYSNVGDTTSVVATLERGERFEVLTGATVVDEPGIVAVTHPRARRPEYDDNYIFQPADTLYVLDYIGEGYYNVWFEGAFLEVSQFWPTAAFRPRRGYEYGGTVLQLGENSYWEQIRKTNRVEGWIEVVGGQLAVKDMKELEPPACG